MFRAIEFYTFIELISIQPDIEKKNYSQPGQSTEQLLAAKEHRQPGGSEKRHWELIIS